MKVKLLRFIDFYKKSFVDVSRYVNYISDRVVKYQIFIILTVVVCSIVRVFLTDDTQFSTFLGVIVSISAACLFEGYRCYRKDIDNKVIIECCCYDFYRVIDKLTFFYLCETKLIHMSVIVGTEFKNVIESENLIQQLKALNIILKKFDDLKIVPNDRRYFDNEEYEVGIDVYQSYKDVLKNKIHPRLEKILNTLIVYSDDTKLVSDFYVLYNLIEDVVMNDLWPEAFKKGQPCTSYFALIKLTGEIINMLEQMKKYLNNEQRKKLKL